MKNISYNILSNTDINKSILSIFINFYKTNETLDKISKILEK